MIQFQSLFRMILLGIVENFTYICSMIKSRDETSVTPEEINKREHPLTKDECVEQEPIWFDYFMEIFGYHRVNEIR